MTQQPELTPQQRSVLDRYQGSSLRVVGAPGTGKTTVAVEAVVSFIADGGSPEKVVLLTGSRDAAGRLRDRIARRVTVATPGPLARTFASLAHAIVRQRSMIEHGAPPILLGGSDEDARWREVLESDAAEGGVAWPARLREQVRMLPEFRAELRELIARATELGMGPDDLLSHARQQQPPNETWQSAAQLWRYFERGLVLESAGGARIVTTPSLLREATSICAAGNGPEFDLIVVDDAQELTKGQAEFLEALSSGQANAVRIIIGDPDIATGMFRGAQPGLMSTLPVDETIVLDKGHRMGDAIAKAYDTVVSKIGVAGLSQQRRSASAAHESAVAVHSAPSEASQARLIADFLRRQHLVHGTAWSDMAVVTRASGLTKQLASALEALGIPTARAGAAALRDSAAVAPLIELMALATGRAALDSTTVMRLLASVYVDLDPLQIRRLRRVLRVQLLAGGSTLTVDERLVELFADVQQFEGFPRSREVTRAARLARVLSATADSSDASPQDLLWEIWQGFDVASTWAEVAGGDGVVARAANERLDAVVALMRHVGFAAERNPTLTAGAFVDQWLSASVEDDSLAQLGEADAVSVGTPSSFLGREFDTVCVAGVNDSVWPNLRLRSSLLDAAAFIRGSASREEVRSDEARLLALAVSRASRQLLVTAVDSREADASEFAHRLGITPAQPQDATTLPALVAQLRRCLTDPASSDEERAQAASALRLLADHEVAGADPASWAGRQSLTAPAPMTDGQPSATRVSPSKIERFEQCQVQWIAGNLAGDAIGTARQFGTLVHGAVERAKNFTADEIERLALEGWHELQFSSEWEEARSREQLKEVAQQLEGYFDLVRSQGYRIDSQLREVRFVTSFDGVELRGSIDWVERGIDGVRIADLKTGTSTPTAKEAAANPQLQSYQLALAEGAVPELSGEEIVDARLVYPRKDVQAIDKKAIKQNALTEKELQAFRERVRTVAQQMTGETFVAHPSTHCEDDSGFRPDCAVHVIEQVTS